MGEAGLQAGRPELITARKRRGLTQEEAADAIGVSPTTWGRWERGVQQVRAVHRGRMAVVFRVDPAEVARWVDGETALCPLADFWGGGLRLTVEAALELWRSELDPSRRHLLAALPFVPAAIGEWLTAWNYDPVVDSKTLLGPGAQVGAADVERVGQAKQAFARIDHEFGAGLVRPALVRYLNGSVAPLLRGRYDDRTGAALMTAAADMTCLAGWMAFDVGRNGLAQRHFAQALRMAKAADDSVMAGWVLNVMSHQAIYLDRPTEALRLANAAADAARQAKAPARLMGRLALGDQALATALVVKHADTKDLHTVRQVERLLGEAERAYAQEPTEREPAWLPPYDATKIVSEAARSWHMLGRHQRAVERAEAALGAQKGTTRSAQLARINAAEAYLGAGELEQALDHAGAVMPTIPSLSSPRLAGRVRRFAASLEPYVDHVGVREFREQVRAQAAA